MTRATSFLEGLENPAVRVDTLIDRNLDARKASNRELMKVILAGLLTCARNGAPLRGHTDDGRIIVEGGQEGFYQPGRGLLKSVIRNRAEGDQKFREMLKNAPKMP